ncbi:hypothetical protein TNCV_30121 [Trichonephila clavipes]|nr:hypothetical protein TNCV_30121 [Trichonephila clavipes]
MNRFMRDHGCLMVKVTWPAIGMVVRRGGASSGVVQITWSVAKSPRVADQCDVNIHSLALNHVAGESRIRALMSLKISCVEG